MIQNIITETRIIEYTSKYTVLKKQGREYVGKCPIHKEKTPSFFVNSEKGLWKCHGCGKGGNIVNLRAEIEGITTKEAYKRFAREEGGEPYGNIRIY